MLNSINEKVLETLVSISIEKAANHFIELYSDELDCVNTDNIYEWYQNSLEQFGHINYDKIEKRIFEIMKNG